MIMHALAVIYVLRAVEGIAEFKLIQHTRATSRCLIVPDRRGAEAVGPSFRCWQARRAVGQRGAHPHPGGWIRCVEASRASTGYVVSTSALLAAA